MAQIPENPLLRLDAPRREARVAGAARFARARQFTPIQQRDAPAGRQFSRLSAVFDEGRDPLELRSDPLGMAPERLLVFELTGDVSNFARAAARVPGLEFVGTEDIAEDELDRNPVLYLLIPDGAALKQLLSLWRDWLENKALPSGFAPWRILFQQLRDIRPWGPKDRVTPENLAVLADEQADEDGFVRLEIELVFRAEGETVETAAQTAVTAVNGTVVSRSRIEEAGYHALLARVPAEELARISQREHNGLVAEEAIRYIRPQSVSQITLFDVAEDFPYGLPSLPEGEPIGAVFDGVPVAGHPYLDGRLVVEDIFDLEVTAVGPRFHGTAMASAVVHGDLNFAQPFPLDRAVLFVSVMFASGVSGEGEKFPDRLPADIFHEAVARMREGPEALAPNVIVINASLGDRNKPFAGQMSGWARVLDYLAFKYGILFVVSAGNHLADLETSDVSSTAFEALSAEQQAQTALRASGQSMAFRRLLSPAEAINALTVGGAHGDAHPIGPLPASTFDVWARTGLCNVSSALGPGYGGATKPDIVATGGRHHVRLLPSGLGHRLRPLGVAAAQFGGVRVAAPPNPPSTALTSRNIGTSVAAALTTGLALRVHEILEAVYDDFLELPGAQRALLLKALLVHSARWTEARDLIINVIGPSDSRKHVRQKDNIRRYLGYGMIDGANVLSCANDRATLWAIGSLARDQSHHFSVPLPTAISGKAQPHEFAATLSWFAPPQTSASTYRGVRLKLLDPESMTSLGVSASKEQPDINQSHRGTVIHRRWTGSRAAVFGIDANLDMIIQREPDDRDDVVPYALAVTIEMSGVTEIYQEVRAKVALQPKVSVQV